jgi:hypothetical protein
MANDPQVTVLDEENRFLEYTHPAVARRLLREGSATVWSKEPFAIKLKKVVKQPNYQARPEMDVVNYTKFFAEEREIFIQNVADAQVTVTFEVATGHVESFLFADTRDPVNLTQYFPFAVVKNSMDLRKMLQRKPAALKILSEEEYRGYYGARAKSLGLITTDDSGKKKVPDVDAAIQRAEEDRQGVLRRDPITDERPRPIKDLKSEDDPIDDDEGPVPERGRSLLTEDLVNPRILHLCNQVKNELTDQEKMPANQLLEELQRLDAKLKVSDWEHIANHGHYKSVKNFARKRIAALAKGD